MSEEIIRRALGVASEGAVALERDSARLLAMSEDWDETQRARQMVISPIWKALLADVDADALGEYGARVRDQHITLPGIPPLDDALNVLVLPFDYLEQKPGPGGKATVTLASGHIDATVGHTSDADVLSGTLSSQAAIGVAFEAVKSGQIELRPMVVTDWWYSLWSYSGLDCRADGHLAASIVEPGQGTVAIAPDLHLFSRRADSGFLGTDNPELAGGGPIGGALNMRLNAHAGHAYQFWLTATCTGQQSGDGDWAFSHARAHVGAQLICVVAEYV